MTESKEKDAGSKSDGAKPTEGKKLLGAKQLKISINDDDDDDDDEREEEVEDKETEADKSKDEK